MDRRRILTRSRSVLRGNRPHGHRMVAEHPRRKDTRRTGRRRGPARQSAPPNDHDSWRGQRRKYGFLGWACLTIRSALAIKKDASVESRVSVGTVLPAELSPTSGIPAMQQAKVDTPVHGPGSRPSVGAHSRLGGDGFLDTAGEDSGGNTGAGWYFSTLEHAVIVSRCNGEQHRIDFGPGLLPGRFRRRFRAAQ